MKIWSELYGDIESSITFVIENNTLSVIPCRVSGTGLARKLAHNGGGKKWLSQGITQRAFS
jgi:hypothetical protein